jgi:hypothetical protein
MGHPFVPTFLLVWALSMAVRACAVPSATLPPERQPVRSMPLPEAAPVTETRSGQAPGTVPG